MIAPLDSISWDCTFCVLSCLVLPLRGSLTWHWRVQSPFTMSMSHDMIHRKDGMEPVRRYQLGSLFACEDCIDCLRLYMINDLSSFTLTLWRAYLRRGNFEWDLRVQDPFTMSSFDSFDSHGLVWSHLPWSLIVFGRARPPDSLDLALPLTSCSCMLNFYTWPRLRFCLSKLTCWFAVWL